MRVALVHDWLTGMRGGEKVLREHARLFPEADLFTLFHVPGSTCAEIEALRIQASPLSRVPGAARHYRKLLPLFPWAIERFELERYDAVLSSSHAVAKGIRTRPDTPHLCYCFTPMRYVWDQADAYLGTGARRLLSAPLASALRRWDRRTSGVERVDRFIGISRTVSDRIRRRYDRSAGVIYPPVDVDRFTASPAAGEGYYLLVGGFVPYKREDVALAAFAQLDAPLWVAGDGPGRAALEAGAPPGVRFLGRVDDAELVDLYQGCRALVYPQEEDFGIIPVEAQAAGKPVIAYGAGGATETVVSLDDPEGRPPTGLFFHPQTPEALAQAVRRFEAEAARFDPAAIRRHAQGFGAARYRAEMAAAVDALRAGDPIP